MQPLTTYNAALAARPWTTYNIYIKLPTLFHQQGRKHVKKFKKYQMQLFGSCRFVRVMRNCIGVREKFRNFIFVVWLKRPRVGG